MTLMMLQHILNWHYLFFPTKTFYFLRVIGVVRRWRARGERHAIPNPTPHSYHLSHSLGEGVEGLSLSLYLSLYYLSLFRSLFFYLLLSIFCSLFLSLFCLHLSLSFYISFLLFCSFFLSLPQYLSIPSSLIFLPFFLPIFYVISLSCNHNPLSLSFGSLLTKRWGMALREEGDSEKGGKQNEIS